MKFFNHVEINSEIKERSSFVFKFLLVIYICLVGLSIRFLPIAQGLEPSWIFAINFFVDQKIIFGKDVFFSYGPLGYLIAPNDVGSNLFKGISFQLFISFVFSALMIYLSFVKKIFSTLHLLLFALLFSQGRFVLQGFDYFVCLLVLMFLSLSFFTKRWHLPFLAALVFSVFLLFVKFVSGIIGMVSMSSFILVTFFNDRKKAFNAMILASVGIPFLFISSYYLYNPSFPDMFSYVKGAFEISSGYSVAMSWEGRTIDLFLAVLVGLLYGIFMFILYRTKKETFLLSWVFIIPLFVGFKHGFVRPGLSIRFLPIGEGGDLSWVYALNYFVDKKIIFGKDVFFTFGPLGFLTYTMDVGSNLFKGISFQLFISFVFSALMIYLSFVKKLFSTLHLLLFALLFSQGRFVFHSFDYFVCLLVLMFLSLSFFTKRWHLPFLAASVLSVLLLFVKFVSGIIGMVSMSSFILATFFNDRKKAFNAMILATVGIPFLFISSYLFYNPSFPDMFSYVKGADHL